MVNSSWSLVDIQATINRVFYVIKSYYFQHLRGRKDYCIFLANDKGDREPNNNILTRLAPGGCSKAVVRSPKSTSTNGIETLVSHSDPSPDAKGI